MDYLSKEKGLYSKAKNAVVYGTVAASIALTGVYGTGCGGGGGGGYVSVIPTPTVSTYDPNTIIPPKEKDTLETRIIDGNTEIVLNEGEVTPDTVRNGDDPNP